MSDYNNTTTTAGSLKRPRSLSLEDEVQVIWGPPYYFLYLAY